MPSFKIIGLLVLENLKDFTIHGRGGHLGHVTWTIYTNFRSPFLRKLHMKLTLIGQAVSEEMFEIVDDDDDDDDDNNDDDNGRRSMGIL